MLTFSFSTIFVTLLPIGVVAIIFSWHDDGPNDPFNSRSLALVWGSPLICFSKLCFLTDSVLTIYILLNLFIFLMRSAYFEQTTQLMRLTFPSEISKASTLHFKVSYHFFTVFKGNAEFLFLCNPQKSGASRVCITFPQITQKILT